MYFPTLLLALSALSTLSTAFPTTPPSPLSSRQDTCPIVQSGDYIWQIDDFYLRKQDGTSISALGFDILATNGGTLNFTCHPHDTQTGEQVQDNIQPDTFYSCDQYNILAFLWSCERDALLLRNSVSESLTEVGTVTVPNYCRAGGAGPQDTICQGVSPAFVQLVGYPGLE